MSEKKIPKVSVRFPSAETQKPGLLASALRDDGSLAVHLKKRAEEDQSKLILLCQHFGIQASPFMFYELALALARELYPEPKKRGRKTKWSWINQGMLVVEVERLVKPGDTAHGVDWACQQLAKREPWKSFLEIKESDITNPDPAEALRRIYYGFRDDKWATVSRDAFKYDEAMGAIEQWEKQVIDFVKNPDPK